MTPRLPDETELQALYRAGRPAEEPGAALDARILGAARAATNDRRAKPRREPWWKGWLVPVSVTATVVLGLTLTQRVRDEQAAIEAARMANETPASRSDYGVRTPTAEQSARAVAEAPAAGSPVVAGPAAATGAVAKAPAKPAAAPAADATTPADAARPQAPAADRAMPRDAAPGAAPPLPPATVAPPAPAALASPRLALPPPASLSATQKAAPPPASPTTAPMAPAAAPMLLRDSSPEFNRLLKPKQERNLPRPAAEPAPAASESADQMFERRNETVPPPARSDESAAKAAAAAGQAAEKRARAVASERAAEARQPAPALSIQSIAPAPGAPDAATAELEADPVRWLERIRSLRRDGRADDARTQLERFRQRYPDFALPAELR